MRSSLASFSGSVDSFQVWASWEEIARSHGPGVRLATRWSHCSWQKTPQDGPMIVAGDTDQADTGKQNHRMHIFAA
jgi:hypothetical protein